MSLFTSRNMKPFIFAATAFAVFSPSLHAEVTDGPVSSPIQKPISSVDPIDYANATPLPLPIVPAGAADMGSFRDSSNAALFEGAPGFSPGAVGNGKEFPVRLAQPGSQSSSSVQPMEFGTSNHPFTTSRVNLEGNMLSKTYPYRAAGKLFFKIGGSSYVCSASLIQPGVVVTAAHCVTDFGGDWYSDWTFVPAYNDGAAPYGKWKAKVAVVMSSYKSGSDSCAVPGVVCRNDVAVIALTPQGGLLSPQINYAGNLTGWLGYGWNGYGFTPYNQAQFTQLGYPMSHDAGGLMQRTESLAYVAPSLSNNSVWGSRQTGGSSGGPEVVNLGHSSVLSGGVTPGSEATFNVVTGVTSWGYTDQAVKQQGASPFRSSNIGLLVPAACSFEPGACI